MTRRTKSQLKEQEGQDSISHTESVDSIIQLSRKSILMWSGFIAFIFSFVAYFYIPSIFTTVSLISIIGIWFYWMRTTKQHISSWHIILSTCITFLSLFYSIHTSGVLLFFNSIAILLLYGFLAKATLHNFTNNPWWGGLLPIFLEIPIEGIIKLFAKPQSPRDKVKEEITSPKTQEKQNSNTISDTSQLGLGLILSIPLLLIIIPLLRADKAFDSFVTQALNSLPNFNAESIIVQLFLLGAITILLIILFSFSFIRLKHNIIATTTPRVFVKHNYLTVYTTIQSVIILIFTVFLISQFEYLYSGAAQITVDGFTYAEYATKGFWELLVVSMTIFILTRFTEFRGKLHTSGNRLLKASTVILLVQTFIILLSSIYRISMYINAYGLTQIRFYSVFLFVFVGLTILLLGIKSLTSFLDNIFPRIIIISALFILSTINVMNPNYVIAKYNINRYEQGKVLDIDYIYYFLGYDASATWSLLAQVEKTEEETYKNILTEVDLRLYENNKNRNTDPCPTYEFLVQTKDEPVFNSKSNCFCFETNQSHKEKQTNNAFPEKPKYTTNLSYYYAQSRLETMCSTF